MVDGNLAMNSHNENLSEKDMQDMAEHFEQKYPIYRKYKNGKEFMKLNSDGMIIQVLLLREKTIRISCTDNRMHIEDFNNPEISTDSSRDEFEKAYGQAQYLLTKANCEQ